MIDDVPEAVRIPKRVEKRLSELRGGTLAAPRNHASSMVRIVTPNVADLYVAALRDELRGNGGFSWTNWHADRRTSLLA